MWRGTDRHTHTDGRDQYTFHLGYASSEIQQAESMDALVTIALAHIAEV